MAAREYGKGYALTSYSFKNNKEDFLVGRLVFKYMKGRRVLDLGCGPTEPIFKIFYPDAREVVAVDLLQSNLDFARKHSDEMGEVIDRAADYRHSHLSAKMNNPRVKYVKGDVTKKLGIGKFDAVMQVGCFAPFPLPGSSRLRLTTLTATSRRAAPC